MAADPGASGQVARGTAVLSAAFVVVGGANYAFTIAMAHLLSPAGFGVLAVVQTFLLFAAWFTSAGLPWAAARRLAREGSTMEATAALRGALVGYVVLASMLAAVLVLLLALGRLQLDRQSATPVLLAAVACSLTGFNAAAKGGLQGLLRLRWLGTAALAEVGVKLGLGTALAAIGLGATGAALGILAGMLAGACVCLAGLAGLPRARGAGLGGFRLLREGLPLFVATAATAALASIDIFAVKLLFPAATSNTAAGVYQASATLARIPYFLSSALTLAVFPLIVRAAGDRGLARSYVRKGVLWLVALVAPVSVVLLSNPSAALALFYPAGYTRGVVALRLLAAGTPFLALSGLLVGVLQAMGRVRLPAAMASAAVVLEVVGLGLGVPAAAARSPQAGIAAAAAAFTASNVLLAVVLGVQVARASGWHPRLRGTAAFAAACLAMAAVVALPDVRGIAFVAVVAVGGLVYAGLIRALGVITAADLDTIRRTLPAAGFGRLGWRRR